MNIARGPLVVEEDLVDSIRRGHLFGAGLDVTEPEPLPDDSPMWDMPEVMITPHVGGQASSRIDKMTDFFCANLRRFLREDVVLNLTEKTLGFPRPEHAAWRISQIDQSRSSR